MWIIQEEEVLSSHESKVAGLVGNTDDDLIKGFGRGKEKSMPISLIVASSTSGSSFARLAALDQQSIIGGGARTLEYTKSDRTKTN